MSDPPQSAILRRTARRLQENEDSMERPFEEIRDLALAIERLLSRTAAPAPLVLAFMDDSDPDDDFEIADLEDLRPMGRRIPPTRH